MSKTNSAGWVTVRTLPGGPHAPRGLLYNFEGVGSILFAVSDPAIADRLLRANRAECIRQRVRFVRFPKLHPHSDRATSWADREPWHTP